MQKPRSPEYRDTQPASVTFQNIIQQRTIQSIAAGLELRHLVVEATDAVLSEGGAKESVDPVTGVRLYDLKKPKDWPWKLVLSLYNGHFIEVSITFNAKIVVLSTVPLRGSKPNESSESQNKNAHHKLVYDGLECIETPDKPIAFVMAGREIEGVLVRDVIRGFLHDARLEEEYKLPGDCPICNHEDHGSA